MSAMKHTLTSYSAALGWGGDILSFLLKFACQSKMYQLTGTEINYVVNSCSYKIKFSLNDRVHGVISLALCGSAFIS